MKTRKVVHVLVCLFLVAFFGVATPLLALWVYGYKHPEVPYFSSSLGATGLFINFVPVGLSIGLGVYWLIRKKL